MRRRWLLFAVILTAPSGCDNVTWGGTEVRLQAPPAATESGVSEATGEVAADPSLPDLPHGPLLLAGTREGDSIRLVVVGEVAGSGLDDLPAEADAPGYLAHLTRSRLAPGTEIVLFSGGVRVGRLTVTTTGVDDRFCTPKAVVSGVAELVPGASQARRFLALADTIAIRRPWDSYQAHEDGYAERVASLNLASEAVPQVGAPWPPSLLEARADIQAFRLPEAEGGSVAATFLFADRLTVAAPGTNAYALFVMGTDANGTFRRDYTWYRRADDQGKGAPRYFSHLDWDGDGTSEVLLDVFGAERRWFAAIGRRDGAWVRTFQDPCGGPS